MQHRWFRLALCATLAVMGSSPSLATEKTKTPSSAPQPSASQAKADAQKPASVKLVDINSASKAELKTLPGIGDAEAERIIAARPYPSKTKLAVDKVIPDQTYAGLKGRIVAVQPPPPKSKADTKSTTKAAAKP